MTSLCKLWCDSTCTCDAKDDNADSIDEKDDANSLDLSWLAMKTRSMENFDLVLNIYHKGKTGGVESWGRKGW